MLALIGAGRTLRAQGRRRLRYRALTRPGLVPLASLETPGRARRFVAQGVSPPSAATPGESVRVTGMVARVAAGDDAECFKAVCVVCPHEQCDVDFVADPAELDPTIVEEIGEVSDPVYLCPCHNSTFTMAGGERLGGAGATRVVPVSRDRGDPDACRDRRGRRGCAVVFLTPSLAELSRSQKSEESGVRTVFAEGEAADG